MAVNLTSIFNSNWEFSLEIDKNIANVLLRQRELSLRSFTLASHVKGESLFATSGVAEGGTTVMIRTLRSESNTAGYLSVRPDLSLKGLDGEDFILEEHWVIVNCFPDALVLSLKRSNGFFLVPFFFELNLILIVRVVTIKRLIVRA
jgi:hypothetical protein